MCESPSLLCLPVCRFTRLFLSVHVHANTSLLCVDVSLLSVDTSRVSIDTSLVKCRLMPIALFRCA